jgi:hypothetical protein
LSSILCHSWLVLDFCHKCTVTASGTITVIFENICRLISLRRDCAEGDIQSSVPGATAVHASGIFPPSPRLSPAGPQRCRWRNPDRLKLPHTNFPTANEIAAWGGGFHPQINRAIPSSPRSSSQLWRRFMLSFLIRNQWSTRVSALSSFLRHTSHGGEINALFRWCTREYVD